MADNWLEKRMEDLRSKAPSSRRSAPTLETLLMRNRSCRSYDRSFTVRRDQIDRIISVNTMVASARNRQSLRFCPVMGAAADRLCRLVRLGAGLPELHLPPEGMEPGAFIVICSPDQDAWTGIDVGISAQSMLLMAAQIGLSGICIGAFDPSAVSALLGLSGLRPVLVIAVGKGAERIRIVPVGEDGSLAYRRENGEHLVPKLSLKDITIECACDE